MKKTIAFIINVAVSVASVAIVDRVKAMKDNAMTNNKTTLNVQNEDCKEESEDHETLGKAYTKIEELEKREQKLVFKNLCLSSALMISMIANILHMFNIF